MMLPTSGRFWHKNLATQKSELDKYFKTTLSPHVRRLHAHNLRYEKQDRFWIGWFRILTAQPVNCAKWFLKFSARLATVLLNNLCELNSIQSIIVWSLHITQFTVCAAKNLTVFVADSPRCLKWSSMAAVSRALRELSTRTIFFYWNTTTGNNSSTDVSLLR